jgi:hypothetical protein
MSRPGRGDSEGTRLNVDREGGRPDSGRRVPFAVGRQSRGSFTMWVLRPAPATLPGPWEVALLLRTA